MNTGAATVGGPMTRRFAAGPGKLPNSAKNPDQSEILLDVAIKVCRSHASTDRWVARQIAAHIEQRPAGRFRDVARIKRPSRDSRFRIVTPFDVSTWLLALF